MLRRILVALCLLASACTPPHDTISDNLDKQKDISTTDVEDDLFLSTLEGIHDVDPWDVLDPSPITWTTCSTIEGDHPCNLEGAQHTGNNFSLYSLYGHPIVLDFSTGWCGPCRNAAAHVQEVQDLYHDQGLIYVTVLIETANGGVPTEKDVIAWANDYNITDAPVVAGSRALLQSSGGPWALTGWPTFYYIDREMVLRDIDRGYNAQEIIHSIEWLLTL